MHSQLSLSSSTVSTGFRVAGTLALVAAGAGAVAAAGVTGFMRLEALLPGQQHLCAEGLRLLPTSAQCTANGAVWNALVAAHGILMLFFVALPALLLGFGTLALPRLLGARDMAFPRLAIGAGVMQMMATALAFGAMFASDGVVAGYATELGKGALYMTGIALLMGAVNAITTFFGPRDPAMGWMDIPVFAWALLAANCVILLSMPVLAAALTTLSGDTQGGLMWVFGHPAILAIVLPALGVVAHGIGMQTGRPLVGRQSVIATFIGAAGIGFFVWAERLLDGGLTGGIGFVLSVACIGGPVLVTLIAAFRSLRQTPQRVRITGWWIISLLSLIMFGMTATFVMWVAGLSVVGVVHQTVGLGVVLTLATAGHMMLSQYHVNGTVAAVQLVVMNIGAVLVMAGEILTQGEWATSVGTLVCVAAAILFVPMVVRALRGHRI